MAATAVLALHFIATHKPWDVLLHGAGPATSLPVRLLRRTVVALVIFAVLWALAGFILIPLVAKREIEQLGSAEIERQVTVDSITFNPFTLKARVGGLVVHDSYGSQPLLAIDEVLVNFSVKSLAHLAPVVQHLQITRPTASVIRLDATRYNFSDILAKQLAKPKAADEKPFRFALFNIELLEGRIDFDDRPERLKHAITDIRLGIPFISSFPADVEVTVQPTLQAMVNDDPLRIVGQTKPFKDTLETTLDLDYTDIDIARYLAYSPVDLKFRVPSGKLDTKLHVVFATKGGKPATLTATGMAALRELAVQQTNGAPAISVKAIDAQIERAEFIDRQVVLRSVRIESPELHVLRRSDGSLSLTDLLPAAAGAPSSVANAPVARPFSVSVGDIVVTGGRAEIEDRVPSPAFRTVLAPIDITVKRLSNTPGAEAEVVLALATDFGARVEHSGFVSLSPLFAHGHVGVVGIPIAKLEAYYAPYVNLKIAEGSVDIASDYTTGEKKGEIAPRLENLNAALAQLRIMAPGLKEPLWRMPQVMVKGASVDTAGRQISIADITFDKPVGYVLRTSDGETHYDRIIKRAPPTAGQGRASAAAPAETPYSVQVTRLTGSNMALTFDDRVPARPVVTRLTGVNLALANATSAKGGSATITARGAVNQRGTFNVSGPISEAPPKGRLAVRTQNVSLVPFQAYVEDKVNVALTAGAISNAGTVIFDGTPGKPLSLLYQGDVSITDIAALTKPAMQDLLRWKSLRVTGMSFASQPLKADVEDIGLQDFYARVILSPEGVFNLQQLATTPSIDGAPASAPASSTTGGEGPAKRSIETAAQSAAAHALPANIRLGKITFTNGNVNFSDFYVKPNYTANLTGLNGTVTEMTPDKPGDVAIRAKIDDAAPVAIDGRINALAADLFLDIAANAKDIDLPSLSPYSEKYAGYGIQKGKLSVTVKYHVENRTLAAENNLYLDQLTFGERVESPTATKLPVLLAVALLKDRNGVIDINLPISGSLDDPHFSMGGLIIRVIVNVITKAVTAPFALLGAAFGGGPELSFIEFDAGSAMLNDGALKRLEVLGKALADRPALKLEIAGRIDPGPDREALKTAALQRKVKAQKLRELMREGAETGSLDAITVEASEYEKFLKRAYGAEKFDKPRNMLGFAKDIPVAEMEKLMLANTQISDEDLRVLANQRAQSAKSFLVEKGQIAGERIFLLAPVLNPEAVKEGKPTRADFSLKN